MKTAHTLQALGSGLTGALVLTLLHETVRHLRPADAPRMDLLGMRALRKIIGQTNQPQPDSPTLFEITMVGDVAVNGLYYSLVGAGSDAWWRGAALGLAGGIGGVLLPGPMGLGTAPSNRTPQTKAMTVAWYLLGGLVAAGTSRLWSQSQRAWRG